ncbi:hypothetical protein LEP1GSC082_1625 [Leptospira kirschneri str. H2]|uniref:Uncharacterized protein n=2 Tax=Leptospira kirschneri TaxID=29507 RepID=A0A0E2AXT1_9LEPT|nr:hypothetical protein LEP1GSC081_2999 [Leptospira kirschneri str. H1]EKO58658.1 hypothetical protein LEP1GSC082_1625 [Leptospira kirschneri str. H2]EMK24481.1 hypothetical protein LEP1GSC008_3265 [Leptospira kirschneri serovar Bulgarica str. Nikolaevo]
MPQMRYASFDDFKHDFIVNVSDKSFLLLFQRTYIKMNFKFEATAKQQFDADFFSENL